MHILWLSFVQSHQVTGQSPTIGILMWQYFLQARTTILSPNPRIIFNTRYATRWFTGWAGTIMWPTSRLCHYTSKINCENFEKNDRKQEVSLLH